MHNPWYAKFSRGQPFKLAQLGWKIEQLVTLVETGPYQVIHWSHCKIFVFFLP